MRSPRYSPNHRRSCASIEPRRGAEFGVGVSYRSISSGLGVDTADVALAEIGEVDVVLGVRDDVVDIVRARHALERFKGLEFPAGDVEPVDAGKTVVLRPDLAVDAGALRTDHIDLCRVDIFLALQRPELEGFGLCDRTLRSWPDTCCRTTDCPRHRCASRAGRSGNRAYVRESANSVSLPVLRIEPAEILLAKGREPDHAVDIDDHIMRLDRLARQIVFGIDDAGRRAGRTRQGLEFEIPGADAS